MIGVVVSEECRVDVIDSFPDQLQSEFRRRVDQEQALGRFDGHSAPGALIARIVGLADITVAADHWDTDAGAGSQQHEVPRVRVAHASVVLGRSVGRIGCVSRRVDGWRRADRLGVDGRVGFDVWSCGSVFDRLIGHLVGFGLGLALYVLDLYERHSQFMERLIDGQLVVVLELTFGLFVEQCEQVDEVSSEREVDFGRVLSRSGNDPESDQSRRGAHRDQFTYRRIGPLVGGGGVDVGACHGKSSQNRW